jgi:type IV fimbrial biogenesis protein FimT
MIMYRQALSDRSTGFTIIELMIAIVVLAILLTVAIPSLQDLLKRNQVIGQTNEVVALIHLARNEAIRRNPPGNQTVLIEFISDPGAATWEGAVYPPGAVVTEADCPDGAIRCTSHERVRFTSDDGFEVRFDNRGYSVTGGGALREEVRLILSHRDCESDRHAREVVIRPTGQVTADPVACS